MPYAVYLVDDLTTSTSFTELDVEDVDFGTTFSVSDIQDINSRKDNITKQLVFKGTKNNNNAFGSLFHLNRSTDIDTVQNKLFFNYNPLRTVDCLIYEDNILILRGTMRVHKISMKDGVPYYSTVVTGAIIDLKESLSDKYLHDLDLSDLQHRWGITQINQSRDSVIEKYDVNTNTYFNVPFSKGSGYVYPFIDYGHSFQKADYNANRHTTHVHLSNMRPAVYVREYFDRIISQLPGYSYEITGSTEDVQKFNSLIVPNNEELMAEKDSSKNFTKKNSVTMYTGDNSSNGFPNTCYQFVSDGSTSTYHYFAAIPLSSGTSTLISPYNAFRGQNNTVFNVDRDFKTDGLVTLKLTNISQNNPYYSGLPMKVYVQLIERDFINSSAGGAYHSHEHWVGIATTSFTLPNGSTLTKDVQIDVGEHEFKKGKQIMLRLCLENPVNWSSWIASGLRPFNFTINSDDAKLILPKNNFNGLISFDIAPGDAITPKAPKDIKQMDFIKSVMSVFNYYVYTERERPKHLIFQSYNDFYSLSSPDVLKLVARDWTDKVDYKNWEIESNLRLPKKYLFTFKDDTSDFFNKDYKTNYGHVYGQFSFNDAFGLTEQKKVELIFSPSPAVEYPSTARLHPGYWVYDSGKPKPVKTNIRLLYYSGVKNCNSYLFATDKFIASNTTWDIEVQGGSNSTYALATEYYYRDGVANMYPVDVLQFGMPVTTYFGMNNTYTRPDMQNIYFNRYMQQVTDLTDANVVFIECDAYLNEIDIANLDLRIPVFIDLGEFGHSYFKVLSVEYDNKDVPAKVKLQKITL